MAVCAEASSAALPPAMNKRLSDAIGVVRVRLDARIDVPRTLERLRGEWHAALGARVPDAARAAIDSAPAAGASDAPSLALKALRNRRGSANGR